MSRRHIKKVSFSIEGEFITQHFRNIVREGDWRNAYEGIVDSLMSDDDTEVPADTFYGILSGKQKLVGVNELSLVDDNASADAAFIAKQYYTYALNILEKDNKFYEAYGFLKKFTDEEADIVSDIEEFDHIDSHTGNALTQALIQSNLTSYDDIFFYDTSRNAYILARRATPDFPVWLSKKDFSALLSDLNYNALNDYSESVKFKIQAEENRQYRLASAARRISSDFKSDTPVAVNFDDLRAKVKAQADSCGGWITLTNPDNNKQFTVPHNPFILWSLGPIKAADFYSKYPWNSVSPSGLKTLMDSRLHSDFWLFTGIDFEDAYDEDNVDVAFFSDMRYRFFTDSFSQSEKYKPMMPLANGELSRDINGALIIHVNDPKDMNVATPVRDSVFIIPQAGPDYEPLARKCANAGAILISETGGRLCHLATVGREMGLKLFMLPNARELFRDRLMMNIDSKSLTPTLADFDAEKAEKNKLSMNLSKAVEKTQ